MISTHTLTWSVTSWVFMLDDDISNFNSHAHVERDMLSQFTTLTEEDFNSHAHVERDHLTLTSALEQSNFNSHAHVERDW